MTHRRWLADDDKPAAKRLYAASQRDAVSRPLLDFISEKNRRGAVTSRGGATYSVRPAGSVSILAEFHYAPVFLTPARNVQVSIGGDAVQEFDVPAGALGIVPAGNEVATNWPSRRECVEVVMTPSGLVDLAEREYGDIRFELRLTKATTVDCRALHLARLLRSELTQPLSASELYVDSVVTLFGIHLLRNYSDAAVQSRPSRGTLSPRNRHRIRDFLAENFSSKLSVAELANVCELSPRHFIKAFTETFGQTPHRYLTDLRLDLAERLLIEGKLTIAEVATFSGFSSQSHLTATLARHRGLTPAQLRGAR